MVAYGVLYCRGLVSAGARGACIPTEILQWVRCTRPEENLVVLIMIFYGENPKLGKFACCLHQKNKCMNDNDSKQILKHGKFNSYQFFLGEGMMLIRYAPASQKFLHLSCVDSIKAPVSVFNDQYHQIL